MIGTWLSHFSIPSYATKTIISCYYGPIMQFTPTIFDDNDHIDLAECAREAAKNGAKVLISNHDTKHTKFN